MLPTLGTTDLFHRITAHPEIKRPRKKESVYWCTVGEATAIRQHANTTMASVRPVLADGTPANFMCRTPGLPSLLLKIFRAQLRVVVLTLHRVYRRVRLFRGHAVAMQERRQARWPYA